jgi:two-component system cell cycle response regulator DivK
MTEAGRKILVVEDNEQNLELVLYILEQAGFEAIAARDPLTARIEFRTNAPDLVLMDMHLPGRDGLSLVKEFRLDPFGARVPIVALTAHAMRGDRERFLEGGCDGYIAKPIDAKTFVNEIKRVLDAKAG